MRRKMFSLILIMSGMVIASSCTGTGRDTLFDGRSVYRGGDSAVAMSDAIEGQVYDYRTKKGIPAASVEIKNANLGVGYYKTKTDSRGRFRIDDFIRHVEYRVTVDADGYVPYVSTQYIAAGEFPVYMNREAVLTGVVRDSRKNPLTGVDVKIQLTPRGDVNRENSIDGFRIVRTDDKGRYEFRKLVDSSYGVTFSRPGYITETVMLQHVKMGESFRLPMILFRPASISGTVKIQGLDAAANNVNLVAKGQRDYSANSFTDGTYTIEDMKPGRYRMRVYHPGFHGRKTGDIVIQEGQNIAGKNFLLRPRDPKVSVYSHRYTFTPGMKVEFNLRTFRIENADITIYRVPLPVFLRGRVDPNVLSPVQEKFQAVASWKHSVTNFRPYDWRYQTVAANTALPAGGYCIEASGPGGVRDRKFFSVTSVGVVAKRSGNSVFAYVTDLVKNHPLQGVHVVVFDNTPAEKQFQKSQFAYKPPEQIEKLPYRIIHRGTTGADGIYHHTHKSGKQLSVLAVGKDGSYAFCSTGSPYAFESQMKRYFVYTDRPVYRAGNTVQYKVVGKYRNERGVPLGNAPIYYRVVSSAFNRTVAEGRAVLDDWGTLCGKVALSGDARAGRYTVSVGEDEKNLHDTGHFFVEQYRKPEFSVDITPTREYFVNGDIAEFKVQAKYFFGAPLKNAVLRYRFYETRLRDSDTVYWWESGYKGGQSYNRIRLQGEKTVDDQGAAVLKLECGTHPYDRELTLEATVTDRTNVHITSKKTLRIGRGDFYIKILPSRNFFTADGPRRVTIKTVRHNGTPVARAVHVAVFRYVWKPLQMVYVHDSRPVYQTTVTTDSGGSSVLNIPSLNASGEFDIVVKGTDRRGNLIEGSRVVWIYDNWSESVASRFRNLELTVDSTELGGEGNVTCLVKSRFPGSYVCLTLEGRDIYESRVVKLNGNIAKTTFAIKKEYAPNLYVVASMQRHRALYTSSASISLPQKDTALTIEITPDREKYLPGEKATVRLKVRDGKGAPLRADLSLACVDESIFQVRPDHTPRMMDFFYSRLANWVLTAYSYPITLLAGAIKSVLSQIRERFEDTAFWQGNIRTDSAGEARVTFTLPDNLTTWRLTARGHDREGRVGEQVKKFLVTQDLVARIGAPRFLVEKDDISLIGIVNSNTLRGLGDVGVAFSADGKEVAPENPQRLSLPGYGSARLFYPVSVPEDRKKMTLLFSATADREARDAIKLVLPVAGRGTPYTIFGVGDMASNRSIELAPLGDTGDFSFRPEYLTVTLNPGPLPRMARASKYLEKYPYHCIEQSLSRVVPVVAFRRLLLPMNTGLPVPDRKIETKAENTLRVIQNLQNDDGTWGWWSGGRGNEYVTAYVMHSLKIMKNHGFRVDINAVQKGVAALEQIASARETEDDARAYAHYACVLWGRWNEYAFQKLEESPKQNPYRTAFMVRSLAAGRNMPDIAAGLRERNAERLRENLASLKNMQKRDTRGIYWPDAEGQRWGWQGGPAEITAHVLSALVEAGDSSPVAGLAASSLGRRGRGDAWSSTKETAYVMEALCGYLGKDGNRLSGPGEFRFSLNGREAARISYDPAKPGDAAALSKKILIPAGERGRRYLLSAEGPGNPAVTFDAALSGALYFNPAGFFSFLKSESRGLTSLSNGVHLGRSYHSVRRVRDMNNAEYMVPGDLSPSEGVSVGDEILVKVRFRARDRFDYLILEDYLPSGFEVTARDAYKGIQIYSHVERRDNRMLYFFSRLEKEKIYEVAYIMRAELPGSFLAKPARMECMYEPSIQGWSKAARFTVKKKD
ncbi:MAG TPA: carboxypeptidase regulatory-like domain-containing protein [Spirochaetota bacterium]|nr:carboxypeptidase regulatory-like domain-containing protein [Spirochaetota bacterium]